MKTSWKQLNSNGNLTDFYMFIFQFKCYLEDDISSSNVRGTLTYNIPRAIKVDSLECFANVRIPVRVVEKGSREVFHVNNLLEMQLNAYESQNTH